ncbi:MAG: phosphate-starvation-inducible PsiE family protein [Deltaproteobacteria bacterium]|nr:phosphate-starvation-inducible PsiE family protein [Deltaproteobacteria bacterium]
MHSIESILKRYHFTHQDEALLREMAQLFQPMQKRFAEDFCRYLKEDNETAAYFPTDAAIDRRKETIVEWLNEILTAKYDNKMLLKLVRIGKTHVKIDLDGHYVNAAMGFIRRYLQDYLNQAVSEPAKREIMIEALDKALDISLDIMTSSYREAELKKVFISQRVELWIVKWAEKLLHGLNLVLMVGLVVMALGVTLLLGSDIFYALTMDLERGVIKAMGSLLILWMMIELLHTQVSQLRGGKFHVRIFVDLAMVAFIRKVFVATIDEKDALSFALLLGGLLVLGLIYFLIGRSERNSV